MLCCKCSLKYLGKMLGAGLKSKVNPYKLSELYSSDGTVDTAQMIRRSFQVQVELYCHSATCGDIQWNEMSCLRVHGAT